MFQRCLRSPALRNQEKRVPARAWPFLPEPTVWAKSSPFPSARPTCSLTALAKASSASRHCTRVWLWFEVGWALRVSAEADSVVTDSHRAWKPVYLCWAALACSSQGASQWCLALDPRGQECEVVEVLELFLKYNSIIITIIHINFKTCCVKLLAE